MHPRGRKDEALWVSLELLANGVPQCGVDRALDICEAKGYEVDRDRVKVRVMPGDLFASTETAA